jgi:hypothetical protein
MTVQNIFAPFLGRTRQEAFEIGERMAAEITKLNPAPVKLKFEKVKFGRFASFPKKLLQDCFQLSVERHSHICLYFSMNADIVDLICIT